MSQCPNSAHSKVFRFGLFSSSMLPQTVRIFEVQLAWTTEIAMTHFIDMRPNSFFRLPIPVNFALPFERPSGSVVEVFRHGTAGILPVKAFADRRYGLLFGLGHIVVQRVECPLFALSSRTSFSFRRFVPINRRFAEIADGFSCRSRMSCPSSLSLSLFLSCRNSPFLSCCVSAECAASFCRRPISAFLFARSVNSQPFCRSLAGRHCR